MATPMQLDELSEYILKLLPSRSHLSRLEKNERAGIVELTWHSRNFAVTPILDVVEVKGQTLVYSGASVLLQSVLKTREKNNRTLAAVIEAIRMAEDNMRHNPERGFALLEEIKGTLLKLARKPAAKKPQDFGVLPQRIKNALPALA